MTANITTTDKGCVSKRMQRRLRWSEEEQNELRLAAVCGCWLAADVFGNLLCVLWDDCSDLLAIVFQLCYRLVTHLAVLQGVSANAVAKQRRSRDLAAATGQSVSANADRRCRQRRTTLEQLGRMKQGLAQWVNRRGKDRRGHAEDRRQRTATAKACRF